MSTYSTFNVFGLVAQGSKTLLALSGLWGFSMVVISLVTSPVSTSKGSSEAFYPILSVPGNHEAFYNAPISPKRT